MRDTVLGELIYDGGWAKTEPLKMWGREQNIKIVVSAYENEKPNEEQQAGYTRLKTQLDEISETSLKELKKYMREIEEDIKVYCEISSLPEDIYELISIDKILLLEGGSFAVLCKAKWDSHGIAVLCKGDETEVGPQDIIWMYE